MSWFITAETLQERASLIINLLDAAIHPSQWPGCLSAGVSFSLDTAAVIAIT